MASRLRTRYSYSFRERPFCRMPRKGSLFVPDRRHLQFYDHAAERLDRAGRAHPAVTDEGDGLALPLIERAVESVLEDRCGTVIVLCDYCHEGVELADTFAPPLGLGLREDAPGGHRRRRLV